MRHRSRTVAIVLAVLSLTYVPISLHDFYLGYYGRGALAIALLIGGILLFAAGVPDIVFGTGALGAIGYVGLAMLLGWFIWQLSDLIRIITGDLKPRNGEYTRKYPASGPAVAPTH